MVKPRVVGLFALLLFLILLVGCVEELFEDEVTVDDIQVIVIEPNQEVIDYSYSEDYYEEYFYEKKANEELEDEKESYEMDYVEEEVDEPVTDEVEGGEEEDPVEEEEPKVPADDCSDGWYITGYFTPHEEDFSGNLIEVETDAGNREFKEDFLETVQLEGWGKTLVGDYVGYYGGSWHINDKDLDAQGNELIEGTVAADPTLLDPGIELTIPTLPSPYNEQTYSVTDTGSSIIGKHIDVFTGEGKEAELETYEITGEDNTICILS